eukprot:UN33206
MACLFWKPYESRFETNVFLFGQIILSVLICLQTTIDTLLSEDIYSYNDGLEYASYLILAIAVITGLCAIIYVAVWGVSIEFDDMDQKNAGRFSKVDANLQKQIQAEYEMTQIKTEPLRGGDERDSDESDK